MIDFNSSYIPRLPTNLVHKERNSLQLLLHAEKPRWIVVNRIGLEILALCDGKNSIGSIITKFAKKHAKDPSELKIDVITFFHSIHKANLLLSDIESSTEASINPIKIKGIFLHLTNRCNLKCIHCYAAGNIRDDGLNRNVIHSMIHELTGMNGRAFTFSGGEPLLRKDWYELLEHASENLRVTLNTNATLIDSKTAALLARLQPLIQISLDGPNNAIHDEIRGKGSFDASIRGIHKLQEAGLGDKLVISMTLMKHNINNASEMIALVEQLQIPKLRFLPLHSQGRAKNSWATLDASVEEYLNWFQYVYYNQKAQSSSAEISGGLTGFLLHMPPDEGDCWCGIGSRIIVDHSGDVYPCALLMDEKYCLGNVKQSGIEEIESSTKLRELTSACVSRKVKIEECRICTWKSLCQSACPALILLQKGTLWANDDFCKFRKKLFEDMIFEVAEATKIQKDNNISQ